MVHTKRNKDSSCELNDNLDPPESLTWSLLTWSLLEKRIGEDLNTLETALSSGLSSGSKSPALEKKLSDPFHFTTPKITSFDVSTK